jgi:hypothetical protein
MRLRKACGEVFSGEISLFHCAVILYRQAQPCKVRHYSRNGSTAVARTSYTAALLTDGPSMLAEQQGCNSAKGEA